jgi:hypothetical protein
MVSFPQASPPKPCAHLSPPPYAPHTDTQARPNKYRYTGKESNGIPVEKRPLQLALKMKMVTQEDTLNLFTAIVCRPAYTLPRP